MSRHLLSRKSPTSFPLAPKWVTLKDPEPYNERYNALLSPSLVSSEANYVTVVEVRPYCLPEKYSPIAQGVYFPAI